jgi:photosystem II stability/assembly factor-like uncharacterized protein
MPIDKPLPANADEFIGSEIDDGASLAAGPHEGYVAHLRASIIEKLHPFGHPISGGSNWVLMGPQAIPNVGTKRGPQTISNVGAKGRSEAIPNVGGKRVLATGRITGIAVHPTKPSIMYVTAARGGVWKTTDSGANWTPKSDNEISLAIGAIGIAPSAPDTLYVGTGEGNIYYLVKTIPTRALNESYQGSGLLKSIDGGDRWTRQGKTEFTGSAFYQIAVHPTNPDIAYAATTKGLYRTTNGGKRWSLVGGLPPISNEILAATSVAFDPTDGNKAWVAFWGSGVYECSNAASSTPIWMACLGFPTSDLSRISLAVSTSSPATVYAMCTGPNSTGEPTNIVYKGVYYTTGGISGTWSSLTFSGTTPAVSSSMCLIAVDISTPDIIYLGGVSLHRVARDTLSNRWSATDIGLDIHVDHRSFAAHPSVNLTVFAGTDGGIYRTYDGGSTWSDQINKGICITQFEFLDMHPSEPAYVFCGTQDNGANQYRTSEVFYHSEDHDVGAAIVDSQDPRNVVLAVTRPQIIAPADPPVTVPAGCYPQLSQQAGKMGTFRSIANGLPVSSPLVLFYPPMAVDQANAKRLAFGAKTVLLDDAQGTHQWTTNIPLPSIGSGLVSALLYVNDSLIYAATFDGKVYRLVSSGGWTATPIHAAPLPPSIWIWDVIVSPSDHNIITVALGGFGTGHVWRGLVNKSGTTAVWTDLSGPGLPDAPVNSIALDPVNPTHLFAGTDVGVFRSLDDGANWSPWREGLPNVAVYDLKLHALTRLLRAATHGRGMWERDIDATTSRDAVIYVRDNVMHTGRGTAPSSQSSVIEDLTQHIALNDPVYWWQCADAKIDAIEGQSPSFQFNVSDVDFVTYEASLAHRNPRRGHVNRIYVQAHNRGIQAADVTVKILYADAGALLPDLPADFWAMFPSNSTDIGSKWIPIGDAQIRSVKPAMPTIFEWNWNPPLSAAEHSCLLIICDSPNDPIPASHKVFQVRPLVIDERHVGLKNLHLISPPAIDAPDTLVIQYQMRVSSSDDVFRFAPTGLRAWNLGLVLPSKIAKAVRTTVKPVRVPIALVKQVLAKGGGQPKDWLLLQFTNAGKPVDLTGLPVTEKASPAYLLLTRTQKDATGGTLNVVQTGPKFVLGGNTFVIATARNVGGRERRT